MLVNNKRKIIVITLFVISFMVCLLHVGKPVQPPFSTSLDLSNTSKTAYYIEGEKANVAIDTGNTRVLFLDKNNKLNAVLQYQIHEDSVAFYNNCVFDNQDIYLLSYEKYNESGFVKNLKIISYDLTGNQNEIVWQKDFDESERIGKNNLDTVVLDSGLTIKTNSIDIGNSVAVPDKVEFSPFLIFKTYLFWICLLYVIVVFCFLSYLKLSN